VAAFFQTRLTSETWTWLLVALGVLLRVMEYADDRPLYRDEVSLLKNLVGFAPLDFQTMLTESQLAPPGFLAVERLMVHLPLPLKPAARLVPLLCALAAIFLMRAVARRYLTPRAAPIAVGLFALNDWLLYYAAEIKQYSGDVALTLTAFLLADRQGAVTPRRLWLMTAAGVIGVWFSHPLALVLAGLGTYFIVKAIVRRQWGHALWFSAMSLAWAASFALCYKLSHAILSKEQFIWVWWNFAFFPMPPRSSAQLEQVGWQLLNLLNSPSAILTPLGPLFSAFLALGLFVLGALVLGKRWPGGLYVLLAPLVGAILASALRQYPFHGRLLIFLVPSVHLLASEGAVALAWLGGAPFAFILGTFLLLQPALDVISHRFILARNRNAPDSHGDLKPDLLDYLEDAKRQATLQRRLR
jgi:hypothetical protein